MENKSMFIWCDCSLFSSPQILRVAHIKAMKQAEWVFRTFDLCWHRNKRKIISCGFHYHTNCEFRWYCCCLGVHYLFDLSKILRGYSSWSRSKITLKYTHSETTNCKYCIIYCRKLFTNKNAKTFRWMSRYRLKSIFFSKIILMVIRLLVCFVAIK